MNKPTVFVLAAGLSIAAVAWGQSAINNGTQVNTWTFTNFPIFGDEVTPHDTNFLARPTAIRVDADGEVTAACAGNQVSIALNLIAGEFFPCQVIRVYDTGTDAITIHGFY
jgi:hypothetical protein